MKYVNLENLYLQIFTYTGSRPSSKPMREDVSAFFDTNDANKTVSHGFYNSINENATKPKMKKKKGITPYKIKRKGYRIIKV